jgi:hypothetical protein
VPRGDPVDGIGVSRDGNAVPGQLVPKSYRPRTGGRWRLGERRDSLLEVLGPGHEGLPDPTAVPVVERGEDLAPARVLDDEMLAPVRHAAGDRVEGADATSGQVEAGGEPARRRDADPQPGERAGAEADRDQVDSDPAAGGVGGALDLGQQRAGVPGTPARGQAQQGLVQRLAVAPGAGGGVGSRGVEADDDQGGAASSP